LKDPLEKAEEEICERLEGRPASVKEEGTTDEKEEELGADSSFDNGKKEVIIYLHFVKDILKRQR